VASKFARLNPVDYSEWSILQEIVYKKYASLILTTSNIASESEPSGSSCINAIIAAAVCQWRRRLSAYVRAGGGHFSADFN